MPLSGVLCIRPVPHFKGRAGGQRSPPPPPQIHSQLIPPLRENVCVSRPDSPRAPLAFHSDAPPPPPTPGPFCSGGRIKEDMKVRAAAFVWASVTARLPLMPDKRRASVPCVNAGLPPRPRPRPHPRPRLRSGKAPPNTIREITIHNGPF